jgi:hypothetical protein
MDESLKLLSVLEDGPLDGSRAEWMAHLPDHSGPPHRNCQRSSGNWGEGFARNPDGGFVWEITDAGLAELEKLRKTPEGRIALREDETFSGSGASSFARTGRCEGFLLHTLESHPFHSASQAKRRAFLQGGIPFDCRRRRHPEYR